MKKNNLPRFLILIVLLFSLMYWSCTKDCPAPATSAPVCSVKGSYSGTFTNHLNISGSFAYILGDNNFISGAVSLSNPPSAFGGYSNTCDSLFMRSWNSINNNYYYFAGKFSSNRATVSGIYKNLTTTTESGTFTLNKQ